jgi:UDP-xylose/UDP-N-acetylglucosamine transporter B4
MVPSAIVALGVNIITQGFCVRGVNRLTSVSRSPLYRQSLQLEPGQGFERKANRQRVNSVTVNLILTVRKAVSLAISVWYYGHGVTPGLLIGGSLVMGELARRGAMKSWT